MNSPADTAGLSATILLLIGGFVLLLPGSILKVRHREELITHYRGMPEARRRRILSLDRWICTISRLLLWLSPLLTILVPYLLFVLHDVNPIHSFTLMALLCTTVLCEYRCRKWILGHLEGNES